jgi:hypothetical protein
MSIFYSDFLFIFSDWSRKQTDFFFCKYLNIVEIPWLKCRTAIKQMDNLSCSFVNIVFFQWRKHNFSCIVTYDKIWWIFSYHFNLDLEQREITLILLRLKLEQRMFTNEHERLSICFIAVLHFSHGISTIFKYLQLCCWYWGVKPIINFFKVFY